MALFLCLKFTMGQHFMIGIFNIMPSSLNTSWAGASSIRLSKHRSRIRRKLANAKQRFLKDEPKRCVCITAVFSCILMESLSTLLFLWNVRPPNAAAIFRSEKRSEYAPQFPELKAGVWVHLRFHIQIAANLAFIFSIFFDGSGPGIEWKAVGDLQRLSAVFASSEWRMAFAGNTT